MNTAAIPRKNPMPQPMCIAAKAAGNTAFDFADATFRTVVATAIVSATAYGDAIATPIAGETTEAPAATTSSTTSAGGARWRAWSDAGWSAATSALPLP